MNAVRSIEAVLFAADSPATPERIADALQVPLYVVEEGLERLGARLQHDSSIQLVRIAGGYQLCTKPEHAEEVARYLKPSPTRFSRSLLETLAIVAYRQPITTAEVAQVRGVQSDHSLRQLAERRLIRETGRKPTPGRPVLWGTTQQFLHVFNLTDIADLPDIGAGLGVESVEGKGHEEQPKLIEP